MAKKTRICRNCKKEKSLKYFRVNYPNGRDRKSYRRWVCRLCENKQSKIWQKSNPTQVRRLSLARVTGSTLEKFQQMLLEQKGVCAICKKPETRAYRGKVRHLSVDHDHKTDKIRGLLCWKCNLLIGNANEDVNVLQDAIYYLNKQQA